MLPWLHRTASFMLNLFPGGPIISREHNYFCSFSFLGCLEVKFVVLDLTLFLVELEASLAPAEDENGAFEKDGRLADHMILPHGRKMS